jgi:hypothetical protein
MKLTQFQAEPHFQSDKIGLISIHEMNRFPPTEGGT